MAIIQKAIMALLIGAFSAILISDGLKGLIEQCGFGFSPWMSIVAGVLVILVAKKIRIL